MILEQCCDSLATRLGGIMNSRCGQSSRTSSLGTQGPEQTHSFEEDSEVVARGVCNIEANQSSDNFRL